MSLHIDFETASEEERGKEPERLQLLRRWVNHGDVKAFEALVAILHDPNHFNQIKRILCSAVGGASTRTIRDVLQDTMQNFVRFIQDDARRQGIKDPFAYIVRMGMNRIKTLREREAQRIGYAPTGIREAVPERGTTATEKIALEEAVVRGLELLGPNDRKYVEYHLDGKSYDEMAAETGLSRDAAKKNAERARKAFKEAIERHYPQLASILAPRPSRASVVKQLRKLPKPVQYAVESLHLKEPPLSYAALVSEIGKESADARLKHAYLFLARKFKVPFPEYFKESSP